jgi:hypothetical protein
MFDREHQFALRQEGCSHASKQGFQVFQIMKGERAVDEGIGLRRLKVRTPVADCRIIRQRTSPRQHFFGHIDAGHLASTVFARPAAEPTIAATKIEDLTIANAWQHGSAPATPVQPPSR